MQQGFEVAVISLERQIKRREKVSLELDKAQLRWHFIHAIAGQQLDYDNPHYDQKKRLRMLGYDMQRNEIACFLSHRKAWQQCMQAQKNYLVLEDDIHFPDIGIGAAQRKDLITKICTQLAHPLIIRLGNSHLSQPAQPLQSPHSALQLTRHQTDPTGAFAYLISPHAAQALLAHSERFFTPIDDFMWRGWEHGYHVLDVSPNLIDTSPLDNPSAIGSRSKPALSLLRKIPREFHRALERFTKKRYEARAREEIGKIFGNE